MAVLSLKITSELQAKIKAEARRRDMNQSEFIRVAVEAYIESSSLSMQKNSCAELARDLLGSIEGPSDLSINADHMEGFGDE